MQVLLREDLLVVIWLLVQRLEQRGKLLSDVRHFASLIGASRFVHAHTLLLVRKWGLEAIDVIVVQRGHVLADLEDIADAGQNALILNKIDQLTCESAVRHGPAS